LDFLFITLSDNELPFQGELMTGYISPYNYLSLLTANSLRDQGYSVNLASPFIVPFDVATSLRRRDESEEYIEMVGCTDHVPPPLPLPVPSMA
jgi:hypothetical protein